MTKARSLGIIGVFVIAAATLWASAMNGTWTVADNLYRREAIGTALCRTDSRIHLRGGHSSLEGEGTTVDAA